MWERLIRHLDRSLARHRTCAKSLNRIQYRSQRPSVRWGPAANRDYESPGRLYPKSSPRQRRSKTPKPPCVTKTLKRRRTRAFITTRTREQDSAYETPGQGEVRTWGGACAVETPHTAAHDPAAVLDVQLPDPHDTRTSSRRSGSAVGAYPSSIARTRSNDMTPSTDFPSLRTFADLFARG